MRTMNHVGFMALLPTRCRAFPTTLTPKLHEIVVDVVRLLPVAAFVFISCNPAHALAFVEAREAPHRPLTFVRDEDLASIALVGLEAFSPYASSALAERLPLIATPLTVGAAVRVFATAYSSSVDQTDASPYTTALGNNVRPGTLAANFLPFGTIVRINEQLYMVEDRLNNRYDGKALVDLWFPTRAQALAFGVRAVEMDIVALPH